MYKYAYTLFLLNMTKVIVSKKKWLTIFILFLFFYSNVSISKSRNKV